ncbi:hypothetical protein [Stutzerimonas kirkiae]|uniref:Uncharacterized protein n=1 Tax=Stutzerimonas kirkiae TaxID=2211392 RepID=A0A4Q9R1N3_9GAMM|nr:hypothetical protein [Stutzerimonas kirkiae]TBU92024.1 hypothetical protein DNJ96_15700 [Stutzerimonas kirkiae]TBV05586.1 hypothetical protein DNK08_15630 [Stutzerimonas kirkiae]
MNKPNDRPTAKSPEKAAADSRKTDSNGRAQPASSIDPQSREVRKDVAKEPLRSVGGDGRGVSQESKKS